jgi:hypothetical protein
MGYLFFSNIQENQFQKQEKYKLMEIGGVLSKKNCCTVGLFLLFTTNKLVISI